MPSESDVPAGARADVVMGEWWGAGAPPSSRAGGVPPRLEASTMARDLGRDERSRSVVCLTSTAQAQLESRNLEAATGVSTGPARREQRARFQPTESSRPPRTALRAQPGVPPDPAMPAVRRAPTCDM